MKKSLVALSLLLTAGVTASEVAQCCPEPCKEPCCPPPCCTPCCTPAPRKCINCEAYNPPFYILQCDWGFFADVEFLYWYSNEYPFEIGEKAEMVETQSITQVGASVSSAFPTRHVRFEGKWEPGFRVGIGWNMGCDAWDLYLNYTWYHAEERKSASGAFENIYPFAGETGVYNPWQSSDLDHNSGNEVQQVSGKWRLRFNQIDLELGKKYWVSRCFNLRPYIGLRGAWIHTNHDISDSQSLGIPFRDHGVLNKSFNRSSEYELKNKFWGVGFLGGLQPNFRLGSFCGCGEFSIYGNVEASLIWGKFEGSARQDTHIDFVQSNSTSTVFNQDFEFPEDRDDFHRMQGILDLGLGLRWEEYWCCDRFLTTIDLGWEHHLWWNFGLFNQHQGEVEDDAYASRGILGRFFTSVPEVKTDLGLGGFVLRIRFDF